ncbi:MAG: hypothetical protein ACOCXH_07255, partial [Cyclobacteriaceae bacterium]
MMSKLSILIIFFGLGSSVAYGQEFKPVENRLLNYRALDYDFNFMPENLLSTRTVVIVSVPYKGESKVRGEWHEFAEKAHKYFVRLGIDAVAYYYLDDILAGEAVTKVMAENFNKRKIENIVFLDKTRLASGDILHSMIISSYNGKETFVDHGQKAWYNQNTEFDNVLINLYRGLGQQNLKLANYLIIDQPEYYKDTPLMLGRRFEEYQPDLKLDKLVVPAFETIKLPANIDDPVVLQTIEKTNQQITADNEKLAETMQQYPFKYGIEEVSNKT